MTTPASNIIETSGGRKDLTHNRGRAYFLAIQKNDLRPNIRPFLKDDFLLVALNYLVTGNTVSQETLTQLNELGNEGYRLFIDSGCFTLANAYANQNGEHPSDVFMRSPDQLPFFEDWYEVFCTVAPQIVQDVWGMVELDFGSLEDRENTRQRVFSDVGVQTVPVFRYGRDPLEEFGDLISRHDRICVGGVGILPKPMQYKGYMRLLELWQEHNPNCFIHILGVAALGAFSSALFSSCDSSTYANLARFGLTCGYCYSGFTHDGHFSKKLPRGQVFDSVEGLQDGQFRRGLGMFQHALYNRSREAHLADLCNEGLIEG